MSLLKKQHDDRIQAQIINLQIHSPACEQLHHEKLKELMR